MTLCGVGGAAFFFRLGRITASRLCERERKKPRCPLLCVFSVCVCYTKSVHKSVLMCVCADVCVCVHIRAQKTVGCHKMTFHDQEAHLLPACTVHATFNFEKQSDSAWPRRAYSLYIRGHRSMPLEVQRLVQIQISTAAIWIHSDVIANCCSHE